MKKTAISLLLVLAMVASFVLVAAPAASAENTHPHGADTAHCACAGNWNGDDQVHECETIAKDDWKPLNTNLPSFSNNAGTLPNGNYYLTDDLQVTGGYLVIAEGANVTICLNGYELKGRTSNSAAGRLFDIKGGTLNITDCGTGGVVTARAGGASGNSSVPGGVVYIRNAGSELNMFGGEMRYAYNTCYSNGGLIYVVAAATDSNINVYGGKMTGANSNGIGDILYMNAGTLNIYDGVLEGGPKENGTAAIYATADATINFNGGKIISGSDTTKTIVWGNEDLSLSITKMGLEIADNGSVGVGYITGYTMTDGMKAKLAASADLNNTAYGLKLWTEGGTPVYAGCNDKNATTVGAHLKNIMNINDTTVNDAANAVIPVKGVAYAVIGGTVVESVPQSFTLKNLIEKMDAKLTDDASLEVLKDLYKLYENVMSGWTLTKINAA